MTANATVPVMPPSVALGEQKPAGKPRGLANVDPARRAEISKQGGKARHKVGKAAIRQSLVEAERIHAQASEQLKAAIEASDKALQVHWSREERQAHELVTRIRGDLVPANKATSENDLALLAEVQGYASASDADTAQACAKYLRAFNLAYPTDAIAISLPKRPRRFAPIEETGGS